MNENNDENNDDMDDGNWVPAVEIELFILCGASIMVVFFLCLAMVYVYY